MNVSFIALLATLNGVIVFLTEWLYQWLNSDDTPAVDDAKDKKPKVNKNLRSSKERQRRATPKTALPLLTESSAVKEPKTIEEVKSSLKPVEKTNAPQTPPVEPLSKASVSQETQPLKASKSSLEAVPEKAVEADKSEKNNEEMVKSINELLQKNKDSKEASLPKVKEEPKPSPDQKTQPEVVKTPEPEQKIQPEVVKTPEPDQKIQPEVVKTPEPDQKIQPEVVKTPETDQKIQPEVVKTPEPDKKAQPEVVKTPEPDKEKSKPLEPTPSPDKKTQTEVVKTPEPAKETGKSLEPVQKTQPEDVKPSAPSAEAPAPKVDTPAPSSSGKTAFEVVKAAGSQKNTSSDKKEKNKSNVGPSEGNFSGFFPDFSTIASRMSLAEFRDSKEPETITEAKNFPKTVKKISEDRSLMTTRGSLKKVREKTVAKNCITST